MPAAVLTEVRADPRFSERGRRKDGAEAAAAAMATSIGVAEFWDSLDDSQRSEVLLVHKVSRLWAR